MSINIHETLLPGVGLRYEFTNADGERVSVIARRKGEFEVCVATGADPDRACRLFRLTEPEADAFAQILGAPRMVESYANLTREIPGLEAGQVEIRSDSPYCDRPLGDTRARTRTGASVVAIVRGDGVVASPNPDEVLRAGDVLVVIGTSDGIGGVRHLIDQP